MVPGKILCKVPLRTDCVQTEDMYLKRVEIECSNGSRVFVRLSHYSLCSRAHYGLGVIYSNCAIFTATNHSPSSTICSHSKIHPYDTVQPIEYEKESELFAANGILMSHHL